MKLNQSRNTISFVLNKNKRKRIKNNKETILDYLNENLEEYGPSAIKDNLSEMTIGNFQCEYQYFPKPIGNIPENPRNNWGLGDYYSRPIDWRLEEANWMENLNKWIQTQKEYLQTLNDT